MSAVVLGLALFFAQAPALRPNVLLVTIDTLRADHLGCYGSSLGATPRLDRLAAEGARFAQALSPVPLTRPAHASLLTGLHPFEHGVRDNLLHRLDRSFPTLATRFGQAGYRTAAFVGSFLVGRGSGLEQGFDVFSDGAQIPQPGDLVGGAAERKADAVAEEALSFLVGVRPPFFVWVHLYDPHTPYEPPAPYRAQFASNAYAGEIAYVDTVVGRLADALEARGYGHSTLLVVTADHGEGLGDHGEEEHGVFVYEESLRVPLLVRLPGKIAAGTIIAEPVRLVDLAPTLLEACRVEPGSGSASGVSLWNRLSGGSPAPLELPAYFESLYGQIHFGWAPLAGLRLGPLKFIEAPRPELYDLRSDPSEKRNLFLARKEEARSLRLKLERLTGGNRAGTEAAPVSPGALEKLASLGYLGAPAPSRPGKIDPKDKIREFSDFGSRLRGAIERFHAGDWKGAQPLFQDLAKRDILSFEVHLYLARCRRLAGDLAGALGEYEAARSIFDGYSVLHLEQGEALLRAGRPEEARGAFARSLDLAPTSRGRSGLAAALRQLGRYREATRVLEEAIARDPSEADLWNELGALSLLLEDPAGAEQSFRRASELRPSDGLLHHNLGFALEKLGRSEEALASYRRAIALDPSIEEARRRLQALEEPALSAVRIRVLRFAGREEAEKARSGLLAGEPIEKVLEARSDFGPAPESFIIGGAELGSGFALLVSSLAPGGVSPVLEDGNRYLVIQRMGGLEESRRNR